MFKKPNRFAARVSLAYFGTAFLWILFSDRAVDLLPERWQISEIQTLKGWFFVGITALLLYLYLRRSLTRQLRESEERERVADNIRKLSHAVDQSPVSVVITDVEGQIEYVNRKFTLATGYAPDEVLGKNPRILESEKLPEEFYQNIWKTVMSGGTWSGEFHNRKKNGELFWEWADISPLVNDSGKITHFVAVKEDITDRKKIAEALRESESRFRQLAETIQDVFWIIGPAPDKLLYVSPAYEKVWGRSLESLYANPFSWLEAVHPEDQERVKAGVHASLSTGTFNERFRIVRPDGTLRWVHDTAFAARDSKGNVERVFGVARDITESRKLEEQLRQAQKMEAIGQLAGGVAHDFNNVLSVLQLQIDMFKMDNAHSPPHLEFANDLSKTVGRAATLTRQLLTVSRQQILHLADLDLNVVVETLVQMLQRVVGEHIRMHCEFHPAPLMIRADQGMMDQILLNLTVNARDAMHNGGTVTIRTSALDLDAATAAQMAQARAGSFVCLTVTDTGAGMSPEILPRIFEPFFTTKDVGKGTGLGLATAFGIVQQHNGWITVTSEVGRGTTFCIYLPRVTKA
jgi:two-component system, cell cycle sensor histidine kinase and response regulator CckA